MRNLLGLLGHILFGLRFRLLLLVALVCAPLIILTLRNASEDRRRQVANWRQRTQRMAHTAVLEESKVIGDTQQFLLALAESREVRGNARACKRFLDKEFASSLRYANLGVIKTNGEILASAVASAGPVTAEDREFFQRVLQSRAFTIGHFPGGQIAGKPTVNFGYPI